MKKEFSKVTQRKLQTNNNIDENSLINIDVNSQENANRNQDHLQKSIPRAKLSSFWQCKDGSA